MSVLNENLYIAICFFLFILFIYRAAKKTILESLDNKINEIQKKLQEAENLKKDAENLLAKTMQEMSDLTNLKSDIINNAITDSNESINELSNKMQNELAIKKSDIIEFIEDKKKKAYDDLTRMLNNNSIRVIEKYLEDTKNSGLTDLEIAQNLKNFTK